MASIAAPGTATPDATSARIANDWLNVEPSPYFNVQVERVATGLLNRNARAVTAGTFVMPAGMAEDMYSPGTLARTTLGNVTVRP